MTAEVVPARTAPLARRRKCDRLASGGIVGQFWDQLVSVFGSGEGRRSWARLSSDRFHGRKGSMSVGAWLPASAQLCRYHCSHSRGLSCPSWRVATSEKSVAARRPLHNAPEP